MSAKISWTLNLQVPGGPKIYETQEVEAGAYDLIEVLVEKGAADKEVGLQPGKTGVQLLMIKSDTYSNGLKYKIADETGSSNEIGLDGPHLLFSPAMVKLLQKPPIKALLSNGQDKPATVQILVVRKTAP